MANNVKNLQNALKWLKHRIREEVKLDGCTSVDHAAELEFIERMLKKFPLRNCEVGTPQEAYKRFSDFCCRQVQLTGCKGCYLYEEGGVFGSCVVKWSRMAYRKGGAK